MYIQRQFGSLDPDMKCDETVSSRVLLKVSNFTYLHLLQDEQGLLIS